MKYQKVELFSNVPFNHGVYISAETICLGYLISSHVKYLFAGHATICPVRFWLTTHGEWRRMLSLQRNRAVCRMFCGMYRASKATTVYKIQGMLPNNDKNCPRARVDHIHCAICVASFGWWPSHHFILWMKYMLGILQEMRACSN